MIKFGFFIKKMYIFIYKKEKIWIIVKKHTKNY